MNFHNIYLISLKLSELIEKFRKFKNSQLSSYTPKHSKIKLSTYTLLLNITTKLLYLYH